jgi:hypothetical protein
VFKGFKHLKVQKEKNYMEVPKEKFTDEELRQLAEKVVHEREQLLKETLGPRYRPKTPEEIEEIIQDVFKMYKDFNEVFGKPRSYRSKICKASI